MKLYGKEVEIPTFRDRCYAEATRDVVFVFQRRSIVVVAYPHAADGEYGHDGDGVILGDINEKGVWCPREDAEYLTASQLLDMESLDGPCAVEQWLTESVWLSREEATAYGEAHAHRWPDGWRVYSVPSEGLLSSLIKDPEVVE